MHVIYAKCVLISHLSTKQRRCPVLIEFRSSQYKKKSCKHSENENEFEHNIKTQILINLRKIGCKSGIIRERERERLERKKGHNLLFKTHTQHSLNSLVTDHLTYLSDGGSQNMQISFCFTTISSLSLSHSLFANYYPFFRNKLKR